MPPVFARRARSLRIVVFLQPTISSTEADTKSLDLALNLPGLELPEILGKLPGVDVYLGAVSGVTLLPALQKTWGPSH